MWFADTKRRGTAKRVLVGVGHGARRQRRHHTESAGLTHAAANPRGYDTLLHRVVFFHPRPDWVLAVRKQKLIWS
jgi:hypothetical protein